MGKRKRIVSTKDVVQPAESTNQSQNISSDPSDEASDPSVDKSLLPGWPTSHKRSKMKRITSMGQNRRYRHRSPHRSKLGKSLDFFNIRCKKEEGQRPNKKERDMELSK